MVSHLLLIVEFIFITFLCGCGGGSTFSFVATGSGNQLAKSSSISIVFQPALPQSVPIGSMTPIAAVVSGDSTNSGVDWLVTCSDVDCGTLSLATVSGRAIHSNSGQPVIYSAPTSLANNELPVNIVAFAATDRTRNVSATFNVTASGP